MPYANVNNHTLHYTQYPPTSTPPSPNTTPKTILFIHGLGSSQNFFLPLLPHLSTHHCILFDNYGAARSPPLLPTPSQNEPPHSIATISTDALSLLSHLSIPPSTPLIIVGHSMGCLVASHLASSATPSSQLNICALILLGPILPSPQLSTAFSQRITTAQTGGMEALANTIPSAATAKSSTPLTRAFIRELLMGQSVEGYVSNCRVIAGAEEGGFGYKGLEKGMGKGGKVLVVAGEEDGIASLEGCRGVVEQINGEGEGEGKGRMEVVSGCGHWHCVEKPEEVGRLVAAFIDGVD
ncbi:MAG: hypothetical protein Q9227_004915 [Pyrenula ochraceoflavens]